ncbi:MAG: DUF4236 domain-containing protein [Spirochaetaceae bacterium]|nr:DUF4236 domain-containing protein [Spirochaetaceae bacterium]
MGVYFKKSKNLGGIRFNVSKSGIGFSTGIKGLRIGVNSKGQSYVSGGTHGVYYRENLNSSRNALDNSTGLSEIESVIIVLVAAAIPFLVIAGLFTAELKFFGLAILCFFGIIIFAIAIGIHKGIVQNRLTKKVIKLKDDAEKMLSESNYQGIVDIIGEMQADKFDSDIISYVLSGVYEKFIKEAIADYEISSNEKNIMTILSEYDCTVKKINNDVIDELVSEILSDNIITEKERVFLNNVMSTLEISDYKKNEINRMLNEYDKIQDIKDKKLIPIESNQTQIGKSCYYVGKINTLSRKKGKFSYEYNVSGTGKIEIYNDIVSLIVDGDKRIKINDILDISLQQENCISMIVRNRKTPIYLESEEPSYIIAIIGKIKSGDLQ